MGPPVTRSPTASDDSRPAAPTTSSVTLPSATERFVTVGELIDSIPFVATCSPDGSIPRIVPFVGSGEDATQFSVWLRRLEDIMRMRSATPTSQQKANFLFCYLDGVARKKIEELSEQDRSDYNAIVTHMKKFFEGPQHLPSATIANRLLSLVQAATTGQDSSAQEERVLEEFVARLRPDIIYCVKLYNPATFEQAAGEAQMVEQ
ncbi:hypothetical protein ANCCEY_13731 [Ancylostoma ceylanicum]|uniref:Retrotransposon gag domain-containing protein n=1 Tax=Ancylostoma ceylanicum TaxID=53326 RepID=A0A0D6LHQ4_9BILA|nr:hypothetical protein ANCCEY_13731 [Ancylostoma ceylanicum]